MSLYNQLFGMNEDYDVLLGMIGFTMQDFERFRDVFLCDGGKNIVVYTRCGGENRKSYEYMYRKMRKSELYIKDFDEEHDNTYSHLVFRVPEKYLETAKKMFVSEPLTVCEKYDKEIEEMKDPKSDAYKRAQIVVDIILGNVNKGNNIIEI